MSRIRIRRFLAVLSVILFFISFYTGKYIEEKRGQTGIRFVKETVSGKELSRISDEEEKEEMPDMTLWKQTEDKKISYPEFNRRVKVKLIDIWGDVEDVYPECLVQGSPLIKEDINGCMLSKKAAYRLFGAEDVIGKKVSFGKKEYVVRGILDVDESVFVRENEEAECSLIEVTDTPQNGKEPIRQVLMKMGVSLEKGALVEVDVICAAVRGVQALSGGLLLFFLYRYIKGKYGEKKVLIWGIKGILVIGCLLLLRYCWCLSDDFIPSKWSDFEFFGKIASELKANYRRYLDIPDVYKDRILFLHMKEGICFSVGSLIAGAVIELKKNS